MKTTLFIFGLMLIGLAGYVAMDLAKQQGNCEQLILNAGSNQQAVDAAINSPTCKEFVATGKVLKAMTH